MEGFIDHINIVIPKNKVEEALKFYMDVLQFDTWKFEEYRKNKGTSFFFRIGKNAVLNIRPKANFKPPERLNYDHFCIVVDRDLESLKKNLTNKGYEILRESNPLGTQGRAPAIYVEDPFGYVVEIKQNSDMD